MDKDFDITESEKEILWVFAHEGGETYSGKIAKKLDKSRQTVSEQIASLEEKNLIELKAESNPKIFEVSREGLLFLMWSNLSDIDVPRVRHHKIFIKFELVQGYESLNPNERSVSSVKLQNWVKFQDSLESDRINFEKEISYFVTPRSMVVQVPEILGPCTFQGIAFSTIEAYETAKTVKETLEEQNNELKFGKAHPVFSNHHYALEKHPMAYALDMINLDELLNSDSDHKLVLDHSKGYPELEAEGPNSEEEIQTLLDNLDYLMEKRLRNTDSEN